MKLFRILLTALISLVVAFNLTGCTGNSNNQSQAVSGEGKQVIKIAYLPITHALPVFEAAKQLKEQNSDLQIELVKYGSWPELMDALNTGRVDGASVLIELAIKAKEQGIDIKAAALGHHDGNVIVAAKEIKQPADLKGQRIAIPHRQSTHNILVNELLQKAGLQLKDITLVELAPSEMPSALAQKQIAAYCVAEPFGAKAVELGSGRVLAQSKELWPDSACCALVLNGKFLKTNHSLAEKLVQAYANAGKSLTDNPQEAKRIAQQYLKQEEQVLDLSLQWISFDNLAITKETYDSLITKMNKLGLLDNSPTYADFVDAALWPQK